RLRPRNGRERQGEERHPCDDPSREHARLLQHPRRPCCPIRPHHRAVMTSRPPPLHLAVAIRGQPRRTYTFARSDVSIGRSRENDLVLDHDSVADRHARIVARGDRVILLALVGAHDTTIDDVRVDRPTLLEETDVVGIGAYYLEVVAGDPPDEVERGFLEAIE